MSSVPDSLISAYRETRFDVDGEETVFSVLVDIPNPKIATLFERKSWRLAHIITAFNPFSEPKTKDANLRANQELLDILKADATVLWTARGVDLSGQWPAEPSFFAVGLLSARALEIGQMFEQNAIVEVGPDGAGTLQLLR